MSFQFNFHFFDDLTKLHHQRRALLKQIPDIVEDVKKARANVDKFIENCFNADTEGVSDQLDNSFKTTSKKVAEAIASLEREQRDVMLRNEQRRQSQSNNMTEYSSNQVLIVDQRCRRDNTLKLAPKPLLGFVAELIKQLKNLHKKEIYFTELLHEKQTEETKLTLEIENCRKAHRPDQGAKKRSAPTVNLNGKRSHTSWLKFLVENNTPVHNKRKRLVKTIVFIGVCSLDRYFTHWLFLAFVLWSVRFRHYVFFNIRLLPYSTNKSLIRLQ